MTDNEIKKALECCVKDDGTNFDCDNCKYCLDTYFCDRDNLWKDTLDLIKRQQAEIEKYKAEHKDFVRKLGDLHSMTIMVMDRRNEIKSEARKEFAERLKEILGVKKFGLIDNLLKEMDGE